MQSRPAEGDRFGLPHQKTTIGRVDREPPVRLMEKGPGQGSLPYHKGEKPLPSGISWGWFALLVSPHTELVRDVSHIREDFAKALNN